jgi:2-polyprenyl-6-methoxyphenol hydroxylase-like FAD-dependent oxidoreductase
VPIAVLGAGLQGTCIALELARRGFDVDLLDQDLEPLNRASLRNEGKIHLGFVYAKDATLRTARNGHLRRRVVGRDRGYLP